MSEFGPNINEELMTSPEIFYTDDKVRLMLPSKPVIDPAEGLQITVDNGQELSHDEDENGVSLVKSSYYALAVAKVLAESRQSPDFWANIQLNSVPGADKGVNVFGRNPASTEAWGKPVNLRLPEERNFQQNAPPDLARLLSRYIPLWEKEAQEIILFSDGVKAIKPETPDFQAEKDLWLNRPDPWQEELIWMNEKFSLVIVKNPHLNGLHLVCHAREKYWSSHGERGVVKVWKTPKREEDPVFIHGFMESNAILLAAEKMAKENHFYNPEIHYSGNWGFKPLDPVSEQVGGREVQYQSTENQTPLRARRGAKRVSEEAWEGGSPNWHAHGHLYATRQAEKYVNLPSRPMKEVPAEWEKTKPLSAEEEERITAAIQSQLTSYLENKFQGVQLG